MYVYKYIHVYDIYYIYSSYIYIYTYRQADMLHNQLTFCPEALLCSHSARPGQRVVCLACLPTPFQWVVNLNEALKEILIP